MAKVWWVVSVGQQGGLCSVATCVRRPNLAIDQQQPGGER